MKGKKYFFNLWVTRISREIRAKETLHHKVFQSVPDSSKITRNKDDNKLNNFNSRTDFRKKKVSADIAVSFLKIHKSIQKN